MLIGKLNDIKEEDELVLRINFQMIKFFFLMMFIQLMEKGENCTLHTH